MKPFTHISLFYVDKNRTRIPGIIAPSSSSLSISHVVDS